MKQNEKDHVQWLETQNHLYRVLVDAIMETVEDDELSHGEMIKRIEKDIERWGEVSG